MVLILMVIKPITTFILEGLVWQEHGRGLKFVMASCIEKKVCVLGSCRRSHTPGRPLAHTISGYISGVLQVEKLPGVETFLPTGC